MAYSTVLVAELGGDKSIYTITSLALRFRAGAVLGACGVAFMGKMLTAVLLGRALGRVPDRWIGLMSALAFFSCALFIWLEKPETISRDAPERVSWRRATAVSFGSLFFTEWCDPGQISAAALAVQTPWVLAVWLGGTLALMTKATLALTLGVQLRAVLPQRLLRPLASTSCCVLGLLSVSKVLLP
jgi:putative Ca2+/H+ antiporter (TMEM165/GDT1 family)